MADLLTQEQLAKLADVSTKTLQRYVAAGKLQPATVIKGRGHFEAAQVKEVRKLWWGGRKKSDKPKTARSDSTGKIAAARLAAARSLRTRLLDPHRLEEKGLEDLL